MAFLNFMLKTFTPYFLIDTAKKIKDNGLIDGMQEAKTEYLEDGAKTVEMVTGLAEITKEVAIDVTKTTAGIIVAGAPNFLNPLKPVVALAESYYKHEFAEHVSPKPGCIVKCDLTTHWEHTGVYVGNGKIVELNGNGDIRKISAKTFLNSAVRTGLSTYVACDEAGEVLCNPHIAKRAKSMVNSKRNYNILLDNCHQFTAGCILGDFDNNNTAFWTLEAVIRQEMNNGRSIKWLVMKGS